MVKELVKWRRASKQTIRRTERMCKRRPSASLRSRAQPPTFTKLDEQNLSWQSLTLGPKHRSKTHIHVNLNRREQTLFSFSKASAPADPVKKLRQQRPLAQDSPARQQLFLANKGSSPISCQFYFARICRKAAIVSQTNSKD